MKLIPMTTFVLEQTEDLVVKESGVSYQLALIHKYAKFLSQPLALWMFVPCDEKGNVLSNPFADDNDAGTEKEYLQRAYNKANNRVLFQGWQLISDDNQFSYYEIEMVNRDVWLTFHKGDCELNFNDGYETPLSKVEDLLYNNIPEILLTETALKTL